jgi:hypothetical protein
MEVCANIIKFLGSEILRNRVLSRLGWEFWEGRREEVSLGKRGKGDFSGRGMRKL